MQANGDYETLVQWLGEALNREYKAIHCYEKLSKKAPTEKKRKQILEIQNDEIKHYEQFAEIYTSLTGREPDPKISKKCPEDFGKGISEAFEEEQKAVHFYLKMGDLNIHPSIRRVFKRAALDEQNHAVWFLSYLYSHQLKNNFFFDDQWHMK